MRTKTVEDNVKTKQNGGVSEADGAEATNSKAASTSGVEKVKKSTKGDKTSSKDKKAKNAKANKDGKIKKKSKKSEKAVTKVEGLRNALVEAEAEAAKEAQAARKGFEGIKILHGVLTAAAHPLASPPSEMGISELLRQGKYPCNEINTKFAVRGVKEVTKCVKRMGKQGKGSKKTVALALFAADIAPVDIMTHLPEMCEGQFIPFIWVRSQLLLGKSVGTKRKTCAVLIQKKLPEPTPIKDSKDPQKGKGISQGDVDTAKSKYDEQMKEWAPKFKKLLKIWGEVAKADPLEAFDYDAEMVEAKMVEAERVKAEEAKAGVDEAKAKMAETKEPKAKKVKVEHT
ncbi:MAG: snoRNA-binding protein [Alyxoria varia]|nr:MAG: snoRNA-binding protein [Alyxoria varia]